MKSALLLTVYSPHSGSGVGQTNGVNGPARLQQLTKTMVAFHLLNEDITLKLRQ